MTPARFSAAQAAEANTALALILGWPGGFLPVFQQREGFRESREWVTLGWRGVGSYVARAVREMDERFSYELAFGLARSRIGAGAARGAILWCRVEGKEQLARARALRPLPTIVLQEGGSTRRLLIWALREVVSYHVMLEANRKIAYRLRAVQKFGDPDVLRVPVPGTFLRVGRSRPVPIVVSRLEPSFYTVQGVTGRLKDPPPQDAWVQRQQGGRP